MSGSAATQAEEKGRNPKNKGFSQPKPKKFLPNPEANWGPKRRAGREPPVPTTGTNTTSAVSSSNSSSSSNNAKNKRNKDSSNNTASTPDVADEGEGEGEEGSLPKKPKL